MEDNWKDIIEDLSIEIAHWHVNAWGGAEYLTTKLAEITSVEQVHTLGNPDPSNSNPYGDVKFHNILQNKPITDSLKNRFGRVSEYSLWEDIDWRAHGDPDVLITSGATTRAVITPDDVLHINYCHSTPRWFYDLYHDRKNSLTGRFARPIIRYLRTRDNSIDPRVDYYLANSPIIKRRIWKYYKRDSTVLYPPIEIDAYKEASSEGFYLHLGRLDDEKGVPAIVDAFEKLDQQLVLVGGRGDMDQNTFKKIEKSTNLDYRGFVEEEKKFELLSRCRAVVFNGRNEDFGIVPIEANASGKACLVPDEGFPGLFIEDGKNGYKHDGTFQGIRDAIDSYESEGIADPSSGVDQFSLTNFENQLTNFIGRKYEAFRLANEEI